MLETLDLFLEIPIWISSEMTLDSTVIDMAEVEENMFEFAISLLDTTIQDSSIREKNNV